MVAADKRKIFWIGPLEGHSGYAEEGKALLAVLSSSDNEVVPVAISQPRIFHEIGPLVARQYDFLLCALEKYAQCVENVYIYHRYWATKPLPFAGRHIWRTTFETMTIPPEWKVVGNFYDQLWVPSEFNRASFARGGIEQSRLQVVPCPVPSHVDKLCKLSTQREVRNRDSFEFLSVMKWEYRKGWDILVDAFSDEFGEDQDVHLTIKTSRFAASERIPPVLQLREHFDRRRRNIPTNIHIIEEVLPLSEMLSIYERVDAFVLPSRGEGWGLPYMESMLSGLPTIGTGWGGNLSFMDDENSFLLDYNIVPTSPSARLEWPYFEAQEWAEPSCDQLRSLMRSVRNGKKLPREPEEISMKLKSQFSHDTVRATVALLLHGI
jgi:glycosyltransferase involved in cell wall biosynthesis